MRKSANPLVAAFMTAGLLSLSSGAAAHLDKEFDRNGGHWDDAGFYHCHLDGCVPGPNRNQFRSRARNRNDYDIYFLDVDWPQRIPVQGCKTARTVALENTSQVPVTWTNPRQCEIREGLWIDEYTGEQFTRAAQMDVDHVITPQYANSANGYQWDYNKRASFTNDPENLIPVSRETAREKRQRSIGEWQPREEFACEYATVWQGIAMRYDLDLFARDANRIKEILERCNEGTGGGVQDDQDED